MTGLTPGQIAHIDQLATEAVELTLGLAANYDHLGEYEAMKCLMEDLLATPNPFALATATAVLAVREHRRVKDEVAS